MNAITTVHAHLKAWSTGGEVACREHLTALHSNPSNTNNLDEIFTVYQTLLTATLSSWHSDANLDSEKFVSLVQTGFESLPSSSAPDAKSSAAAAWGELLIDMVWSLDVELDEIIAEAKAAEISKDDDTSRLSSTKKQAELDKDVLIGTVKKLLAAGIIQPGTCRERLDTALLASAGIIADKLPMDRKEVRFRTSLFYKQNKVNLLREQSEGYSKLTAELTGSVGPSHSTATGRPAESPPAIEARAHQVWERVLSLIGHFDLDPNRALDIFLDVFSTHLASHHTFFLSLLSLSPWAPPKLSPEVVDPASEPDYGGKELDEILFIAEARSNATRRSDTCRGSSVLAQVLGFKFCHYQHPDVTEVTPMNLYLLAAILIREEFITLEDLFPHLAPDEEGMEKAHKDYLEKVEARIAGAKVSQLAMAAPLESAAPSTARPKASSATPKPVDPNDKSNQKIGITVALLSVGVLRPAISLLTKYPWMVDAHTQLADLMLRILKHSVSSFFETFVTKDRIPGFSQPRARYGAGGVQPAPPRKQVLSYWAPTPPSTSLVDFVFFYPEWLDRVPVCASFSDLADVVEPLMRFVGVHISREPAFITKYLRLGRAQINGPPDPVTKKTNPLPADHPARQFWFKILRLYMLPALSLIRGNAVCAVEVWNTIRAFDITQRWRLYGEWKTKMYKSHPELRVRAVQVDREAKGILRRLSHNTIDSLAGPVAKLTHSNPCIFFANAVNQIMSYDNLAGVVIQVLRYSTNMGFDVLVYIILDALSNPHKQRVKEDGVNTSDWLQSLASFTGMLFRRYSADLTPVIKYIVHQLYNGQTSEIVVLRELIWKMAGIEPLPSLSESQISSMAGGPTLRIEAVASTTRGARLDPSEITQRGPQRLGKALLESSLALPLLIQVAQQRQSCVYTAQDAHLKSLAGLYDTTHGVLLQYLDLLISPDIISPEEYAKKVLPSLADLGEHYGISAPICMQIIRPRLNEALLTAALAMEEQERAASEETEKRLKAALSAKREPAPTASRLASPAVAGTGSDQSSDQKMTGDERPSVGEASPPEDVAMEVSESTPASAADMIWLPELSAMFDDVRKIAPGNSMELIGPGFYLTFWQLSTYDLSPPATRYDEEGSNLRTLSRQEDMKYQQADRSSDRAKRATAAGHRQRRDRYNLFVQKLAKEFKEQTAARAFTMKRLAREKNHWFADSPKPTALIPALIEHCFQPRCLLSPMDADFCAQFVRVMHLQGTPGFWTLTCYDRLLGDHVKNVVFSCSEYEAKNYGRFLFGILSDLLKWHQDEQLYLQDNRTKSGGKSGYLPGLQLRWTNTSSVLAGDLLKWSDLQLFNRKCHRKLSKCLTECIETGEFMHVYNTIIVLKEILPVFPIAAASGTGGYSLATAIDTLLEKEERGDLKILARAYSASLKKREALWALPSDQPQAKTPPTQPSVKAPIPEKPSTPVAPRSAAPNGGSADQTKGSSQLPPLPPSAPRAHLSASNGIAPSHPKSSIPANPTKLAMESVPRPDFVKRVRPDSKSTDGEKPIPTAPADLNKQAPSSQLAPSRLSTNLGSTSPLPIHMKDASRPSTPTNAPSPVSAREPPQSPRGYRTNDDRSVRGDTAMPPPTIPSQKPSAQELRETAKLTIGTRTGSSSDKPDERGSANGDIPTRRRSPSPNRPGTRNNSSESRASGGNSRSDSSGDHERSEGKGSERQEDSRGSISRRDSTRSDRGGRERTSTRDGERDKDGEREKERERHGDRDRKEKDRDRDRERERDRDREKDRDRNRERDSRDRHRRDDRERKDSTRGANAGNTGLADLPSRPESGPRHRPGAPNGEDGLGKRRRPTDDDPERTSKRSSRKDGHHDDRRRSVDDRREAERRRRDREGDEKSTEKRTPDAPASTGKSLPPSTPSAPRAMASDGSRSGKSDAVPTRDRDWKAPPTGPGSLRSRIGEKSTSQAETPSSAASNKDDSDRDSSRKRTASEREKDAKDAPAVAEPDPGVQPSKRPKINRNRYGTTGNGTGSSAFARKTLPLAEKGRTDWKD